MLAIIFGKEPMVQQLIAAHADLTIKDNDGKTALMHAVRHVNQENTNIIHLLAAAGADDTIQNEKDGNKTALDYALDRAVVQAAIEEGKKKRAQYLKAYHERQKLADEEIQKYLISDLVPTVMRYAYGEDSPEDLPLPDTTNDDATSSQEKCIIS